MERVRVIFLAIAVLFLTHDLTGEIRLVMGASESYEVALYEENGKVGLKSDGGKILIPAEYDAIGWSNGPLTIVDQVVGYKVNGLWGLISTSNRVLTEPQFLEIEPAEGAFLTAQKKSPLSQRASFGVINTSGKTIIPFVYDALYLSNMRAIVMSRVGAKFLFGLSDLSHKILIPIQYKRISSIGSLRYAVENFDSRIAIFSDDGSQVTAFEIDSISTFRRDFAIVYHNQKQGIINRSGQFVARPVYAEVKLEDDGSVLVRDQHQLSLLKGDNALIKQLQADNIRPLSADRYALEVGGKYYLTDNDVTALHPEPFASIGAFENGVAVFTNNSRAGVVSATGDVVIPAQYLTLERDEGGLNYRACVNAGGKTRWTIIDAETTPLTEKQYEMIAPFNGKFYPAKSHGYWGALNAAGQEIIACVHDSLLQESHGNIVVKFKGEYGIVNLREHWVVTPRPYPLRIVNEETFFEYDENTTYLKSFRGDLIYFSDNPLEYVGGYIREQLPSGAYWVIDLAGTVVDRSNQPVQADLIFPESEGLRAIRKDGKFGFIDKEGRLRIANRYEMVQPFSDGLAAIRIRNRWGYIDHRETLVVQPIYDEVNSFANGVAIVYQDGYAGLVNNAGKMILPLRYDQITPNEHHRYLLTSGELQGLADESGKVIVHPRYHSVSDTGNGYAIVERDGKYGVVTLDGVSTIPLIYDDISYDHYRNQYIGVRWSALRPLEK